MLVFLSDLHFTDGSAGEHNLPTRAFDYFFDDLVTIAKKPSNNIKEIKIVLLGDIFDLLRTEGWFEAPEDERPWGNNETAIEDRASRLLDAIVEHRHGDMDNSATFRSIRLRVGDLQQDCNLSQPARLLYIPGNHDRLINKYSRLRVKVCDVLGIPREWHNPAYPFPRVYGESEGDVAYGVFARHGHEHDKFNYEGGSSYTQVDYERVPIGDPITTELVSRLPYALERNLKEGASELWPDLSPAERDQEIRRIKMNFQEIENVRPLSAVVNWLLYKVRENRYLKEVIEDAVDNVVSYFDSLRYVQFWYARHDRWTSWRDEADQIQAVLFLLKHFKLYRTENLWDLAMQVKDRFVEDKHRKAASEEFPRLDSRIRYVVYGHTHDPLVAPLRSLPGYPHPVEQVYLNTGTWRTRHSQADYDHSFVSWKNMTYVIFYREGERAAEYPVFETWTGTLKSV